MGEGGGKFALGVVAGVAGLFLLCICCVAAVVLTPFGFLAKSGAHQTAKAFLTSHPTVQAELGEVKKVSQKLQGHFNQNNDQGSAELHFDLEGNKAKGLAKVTLHKESGKEWTVDRAELDIGGRVVVLKE